MHEWMVDNDLTPHLVVDATRNGLLIPEEQVKDGKIVLNVSHSATRELTLGNETISFHARFGGTPRRLEIPVGAVLGIYARETGQGMIFGDDDGAPPAPAAPTEEGPPRPKLKVVK